MIIKGSQTDFSLSLSIRQALSFPKQCMGLPIVIKIGAVICKASAMCQAHCYTVDPFWSVSKWGSWDSNRVTCPTEVTKEAEFQNLFTLTPEPVLFLLENMLFGPLLGAPLLVSLIPWTLWSLIVILEPAMESPWPFCSFIVQRSLSFCVLRSSKELLLQPVTISRNEKEKVLIEGSINSVRVSIAVKQVSSPQIPCLPGEARDPHVRGRNARFRVQRNPGSLSRK